MHILYHRLLSPHAGNDLPANAGLFVNGLKWVFKSNLHLYVNHFIHIAGGLVQLVATLVGSTKLLNAGPG